MKQPVGVSRAEGLNYSPMEIMLRKNKEVAVQRRHPWVFSGAIYRKPDDIQDGDTVEVVDAKGDFLAAGHYQNGSIAVRLLSFEKRNLNPGFWKERLHNAYALRKQLGLGPGTDTTAYRLIHAEGDGLPGLIVDIYHQTAVMQCHSAGMYRNREMIAKAIASLPGISVVYNKSVGTLQGFESLNVKDGYLVKTGTVPAEVRERGHKFLVNWETGQKTGFFLDQRPNRALLGRYAASKSVLNTFSYSGGFSVYALAAGASKVVSVDVSAKATDLVEANIAANGFEAPHEAVTADVLTYLQENETSYDIVVVDPPAFAKSQRKRHNAVQGYKRLNALALRRVKPGGLLFTFSCSQVVDKTLFDNTITAAALEVGRPVRVLHHLSQGPDHPVSIYHPEGSYLKGLVLEVG